MDSDRYRQVKSDRHTVAADESNSTGFVAFGGVVLILGGLGLILLANASVADVAGTMLGVMGLALLAASLWLVRKRP